jgi:hypothetical protein
MCVLFPEGSEVALRSFVHKKSSSGNNSSYQQRLAGVKVILELKIRYEHVYTEKEPVSFYMSTLTGIQITYLVSAVFLNCAW